MAEHDLDKIDEYGAAIVLIEGIDDEDELRAQVAYNIEMTEREMRVQGDQRSWTYGPVIEKAVGPIGTVIRWYGTKARG
jgi:hypothetical protein